MTTNAHPPPPSANDYSVHDDGHPIGRIRLACERTPSTWQWAVTEPVPGPPFGDAKSIDEAKARFKAAWEAFAQRVGGEAPAKAYAGMNEANREGQYLR